MIYIPGEVKWRNVDADEDEQLEQLADKEATLMNTIVDMDTESLKIAFADLGGEVVPTKMIGENWLVIRTRSESHLFVIFEAVSEIIGQELRNRGVDISQL